MKTAATENPGGEAVTAEQLERINQFTRRELTADEVYVFSVILCDNEVDRDYEQFPEASLEKLGELFVGKTGVFDHDPKAENQSARIFETKLLRESGTNSLGEPYICLKAWAYTVRCEKNADLILEIDAGIKKEVSVGCAVDEVLCSICGANQKTAPCSHQKGESYDSALCYHLLMNPADAYEWSFVAVPAQKNAGVTKTKKSRNGTQTVTDFAKLFSQQDETVLSRFELESLKKRYDELEILADAGRAHIEALRRDVIKLAALAEPNVPAAVMESITKKLNVTELTELQKTFGRRAAKAYPVEPQLAGRGQLAEPAANHQFKI